MTWALHRRSHAARNAPAGALTDPSVSSRLQGCQAVHGVVPRFLLHPPSLPAAAGGSNHANDGRVKELNPVSHPGAIVAYAAWRSTSDAGTMNLPHENWERNDALSLAYWTRPVGGRDF